MAKREKKFFRDCPKCGKQVGHVKAAGRDVAAKKNTICASCATAGRNKGRTLTAEHKAKIGAKSKGKTHTAEARAKMLDHYQSLRDACAEMYGEKTVYQNNYFTKWAKAVKTRDSYTCVRCNTVATGNYISAHHVMPKAFFPETALNIDNGVTLCNSCHKQIHADLDKLTNSGIQLSPVGFQEHAARFIADGKASSQSIQTPLGYKSVFSPSVTIVKE
tara:strand:+ start:26 stop:679 length:654 start_codon:yes stop_codon:yes gene_type:complete